LESIKTLFAKYTTKACWDNVDLVLLQFQTPDGFQKQGSWFQEGGEDNHM